MGSAVHVVYYEEREASRSWASATRRHGKLEQDKFMAPGWWQKSSVDHAQMPTACLRTISPWQGESGDLAFVKIRRRLCVSICHPVFVSGATTEVEHCRLQKLHQRQGIRCRWGYQHGRDSKADEASYSRSPRHLTAGGACAGLRGGASDSPAKEARWRKKPSPQGKGAAKRPTSSVGSGPGRR